MEKSDHGGWDKGIESEKGHWDKAYESDIYKQIKKKRFGAVIPIIILFCLMFFILFTIQSLYPDLSNKMIIGNFNFNFIYSMLVFPITWVGGLFFLRYIRKNVYPLEEQLVKNFSKKSDEEVK